MFVGVFLAGSFYWSMDQVLVQRVFAARDLNEGRKGVVLCAFLKVLTPFLLVMPGLIAKALYAKEISTPDDAYPTLLKHLMPTGLLGLTVAGVAAALMGHLSATFNSIATMFTRDFYVKFKPSAGHSQQIIAGRLAVIAVAILGALWAPVIGGFKSLFLYLQSVGVYLVMPFVAVFFLGVLWRRITTAGVWASVLVGFVIGPVMLFDSKLHFIPFIANSPILRPWLNAAILEFLACAVVLVSVSLFTKVEPDEKVAETTLFGQQSNEAAVSKARQGLIHDYRPWLVLVTVITACLWYVLR
jgi:solute:Na+ symporter, SSS family